MTAIDQIFDENNTEPVVLYNEHGDPVRFEQIALIPLCDALFADVNPIPVKYALSRLGLCTDEVRLPLSPAEPSVRALVDAQMAALGM